MTALTPTDPRLLLPPPDASKDVASRLRRYEDWMRTHGRAWWQVDLAAYRDWLMRVGGNDGNGLAESSTLAHLGTIRVHYQRLLADPALRRVMMDAAGQHLRDHDLPDTPAERRAVVEELYDGVRHAIDPAAAPVKPPTDQDPAFIRLTVDQANELLEQITDERDKAIVALLLATGIREAELCALDVRDLRSFNDAGSLALHVRHGKGDKSRRVPYGDMDRALRHVDEYLYVYGIREGRVFNITTRTVQRILARYPVWVNGELTHVRPHSLRRTYARRLYESGVALEGIRQNLGHADIRTTQRYVGTLDDEFRRPGNVFRF